MLDECKGDKFEELLASFSVVVLKKTLEARGEHRLNSGATQPANIVPLILSYRKGIQRDLEQRKEIELQAKQQHRNLDAAIKALSKEAEALTHKRPPETPANADALKRMLRESWIGDNAWVDSILHGVPHSRVASQILAQGDQENDASSALLAALHARVDAQNERLAKWQSYLTDLQQHKEKHHTPVKRPIDTESTVRPIRFSRHKNLGFQTRTLSAEPLPLKPHHAALLEALEKELAPQPVTHQTPTRPSNTAPIPPTASRARPVHTRAASLASGISSQDTIVAEQEDEVTPVKAITGNRAYSTPPDETPKPLLSLHERTRASLAPFEAQFETPRKGVRKSGGVAQPLHQNSVLPSESLANKPYSDRTSLLERTRQSMSMLANVLEDSFEPRAHSKSKKPTHTRSKTAIVVPAQRRRLERAWSEESLASTTTKDELDLDADYESVFKSRPRLAMSPNLSPQRSSNDLWLDSQLEEGMNKLTIDSSPEL